VQHSSAGCAKDVLEGTLVGVGIFADFEIEDGQGIGFFPSQIVRDMVVVAAQKA
jgi:hypothetical protein